MEGESIRHSESSEPFFCAQNQPERSEMSVEVAQLRKYSFAVAITYVGAVTVEAYSLEEAEEAVENDLETNCSPLEHRDRNECWTTTVEATTYLPE